MNCYQVRGRSSSGKYLPKGVFASSGLNLPECFCSLGSHEFPVMREQCARLGVSKLQGNSRSVLRVGQEIGSEAVTQCVIRPVGDSGSTCRFAKMPLVGGRQGTDWAALPGEWHEPGAEILRYRHQSALGSLGFGGGNLDKAPAQIDRTPIESHDFRGAQTGEHADGHSRENRAWTSFEQSFRLARQ